MNAVVCEAVTKDWGGNRAVSELSFTVQEGDVVGLLGTNGAGKTTTLKMLSGLVRPTSGRIKVLGYSPWGDWPQLKARVGVLIDAKFPPYLTARENLIIACDVAGIPRAQAKEWLQVVGLERVANEPTNRFSFGMIQRLGLAQAMLGDPDLLILDEPLVGLDPAAITDFKQRLDWLRNKGTTIVFSSHQLTEVEELCTRVIMIDHGRVSIQGSVNDLRTVDAYLLQTPDAESCIRILGMVGLKTDLVNNQVRVLCTPGKEFGMMMQLLCNNNISVLHVEPVRRHLEQLFFKGGSELVATAKE